MTSLDAQCLSTSTIIAQSVLEKDHWRAFGYRKRPRRGKVFDSFISPKKLERETVLLREFWAASFGRAFYWAFHQKQFRYRIDFIARLMDFSIDGLAQPLWPPLSFITANDAVNFLVDACQDYGNTDLKDHAKIFLQRCQSHLDQDLPMQWVLGSAWLFADTNSLIATIIFALNTTGVAKNQYSDIEVRKTKYLEISKKLFDQLKREI